MADLDPQKMIEAAFGHDPMENHPLAFVREAKFKELVQKITGLYEEYDCDIREIFCSMIEILTRISQYPATDPRTTLLVGRAAPIIRQLLAEQKQGPELLMIIAAMLTNVALFTAYSTEE